MPFQDHQSVFSESKQISPPADPQLPLTVLKEESTDSEQLSDPRQGIAWDENRASFWQSATGCKTTAISRLLAHVASGEEAEADVMLTDNPALSLQSGSVIDFSGRRFTDITALQYALWAMDWRMWRMLLRYISKETAWQQYEALEKKGTAYGTHFSLVPLINALEKYLKNYDAWYQVGAWDNIKSCWAKQVGGAQFLLPAHVAQEYCHPERSFDPLPNFEAEVFQRSLKMDEGNWYNGVHGRGRLGETFGIIRGGHSAAFIPRHRMQYFNFLDSTRQTVECDLRAMRTLLAICQMQLQEFKSALQAKVTLRV